MAPELSALVTYIEPAPLGNLADRINDVKVRVACQKRYMNLSITWILIDVLPMISFSHPFSNVFSPLFRVDMRYMNVK